MLLIISRARIFFKISFLKPGVTQSTGYASVSASTALTWSGMHATLLPSGKPSDSLLTPTCAKHVNTSSAISAKNSTPSAAPRLSNPNNQNFKTMTPIHKTDDQDLGQLIQAFSSLKIIPERFSISMPVHELERVLTAAYITEVAARGFQPLIDSEAAMRINSVARWLADPRGKCGLMLQGLYGNGKSTMLQAVCAVIELLFHSLRSNERLKVRIVDAKEIARVGSDRDKRAEFMSLLTEPILAIDDLGDEPAEILVYGMLYTPVRDLLEYRYKAQLLTIVSTNLLETVDNPMISSHYGPRVLDRLREMMHIVVFNTPSYRNRLDILQLDCPVNPTP